LRKVVNGWQHACCDLLLRNAVFSCTRAFIELSSVSTHVCVILTSARFMKASEPVSESRLELERIRNRQNKRTPCLMCLLQEFVQRFTCRMSWHNREMGY